MSDEIRMVLRTDPKTGMAFVTKKACEDYIQHEDLKRKGYEPQKYQGGWAAAGPAEEPAAAAVAQAPAPVEQDDDGKPRFLKIIFSPQFGDNDSKKVPAIYRGMILHFDRGVEVVIPRKVLEQCIDHAVHQTYVSTPSGHKPAGYKRLYHYQLLGPATEAEWMAFRQNTRNIQSSEYQTQGLTMPVAQSLAL